MPVIESTCAGTVSHAKTMVSNSVSIVTNYFMSLRHYLRSDCTKHTTIIIWTSRSHHHMDLVIASPDGLPRWRSHHQMDLVIASPDGLPRWRSHHHMDLVIASPDGLPRWRSHHHMDLVIASPDGLPRWRSHHHMDLVIASPDGLPRWRSHHHMDLFTCISEYIAIGGWKLGLLDSGKGSYSYYVHNFVFHQYNNGKNIIINPES